MDYRYIKKKILQSWFEKFAEHECKEVSPLYYQLSSQIVEDDELISIASFCKQGQPIPNLFLAAVHFLLLKNQSEELAQYYPSITKDYLTDLPFDLFKQFCLERKQEIIAIEQSKIVQTNALNRCAYLMPILSHLFGGQEINIIDIGTSAGLTLNMDQYEYHYNDQYAFGESPVKIRSEIRAGELPQFTQAVKIATKIGIDQNPLDLKDKENEQWLKALIWADLVERIEKINQAIKITQQSNIDFRKASTLEEFEAIIQAQDESLPLVIYHTHVLYQFELKDRKLFWTLIDKMGSQRELTYIATEGSKVFKKHYGIKGILVELTQYQKGQKQSQLIAETNGHANWIKWEPIS